MPRWMAAMTFLASVGLASRASAEARPYRGPHPVTVDGPWHMEASVHVHDTLPVGEGPFASLDGVLIFLGDPSAYGWQGEVYTYAGAHPLPPRWGIGYCGIAEEHAHPFAPEGEFRALDSGAFLYQGALRGGAPTLVPGRTRPVPDDRDRVEPTPGIPILDGESTEPSVGNVWYFWYAPAPRPPCPRPPCRPHARPAGGTLPPTSMDRPPPRPRPRDTSPRGGQQGSRTQRAPGARDPSPSPGRPRASERTGP